MKSVIFLGDGMADYPIAELGNKTPLQVAIHPHMDRIANNGVIGRAVTIPEGMPKGSDVANLSVFGVDPKRFYTGRSPLEAISLGIELSETDVTYRCNLVTLSDEEGLENKTMLDYSAGEITSEEGAALISVLQEKFGSKTIEFFAGVSYRHCLVLRDADTGAELIPPHDITNRALNEGYLPKGTNSDLINEITEYSIKAFKDHPVNLKRIAEGKNPATSVWLWGEGRKPALQNFKDKFGVTGGVISAVDLIHGIAIGMGMKSIEVKNITGNFHTDFKAKGQAAIKALSQDCDFVYIHVEAPDECGHQNQLKEKIWSIEQIDEHIVGPVLEYLEQSGENFSVLVMPDHPTPIAIRTHTGDAVPFAMWHKEQNNEHDVLYNEHGSETTGLYVGKAHKLINFLMNEHPF